MGGTRRPKLAKGQQRTCCWIRMDRSVPTLEPIDESENFPSELQGQKNMNHAQHWHRFCLGRLSTKCLQQE